MTEHEYIHQLDSFRVVVLRVIESFVCTSLEETISLTKMASVINTNPMILELRQRMKDATPKVDSLQPVTIRDVILSITKIFSSSQIHIMENNDYFRIRLAKTEFEELITGVYEAYRSEAVKKVREDEEEYKTMMEEIKLIEKGEMDPQIMAEGVDETDEKVVKSEVEPKTPKKRALALADDEDQQRKKTKIEGKTAGTSPNKKLQLVATPLIASMSSYKYASTFLTPVNEAIAPDYYKLVKEPRDLKTIKQMVKDGRIKSSLALERDISLMFANAIMYNRTGSDIYGWARQMQSECDKMIEMFKGTLDG